MDQANPAATPVTLSFDFSPFPAISFNPLALIKLNAVYNPNGGSAKIYLESNFVSCANDNIRCGGLHPMTESLTLLDSKSLGGSFANATSTSRQT